MTLTAAAGAVARVAGMAVSLVTVPLTLHYLGDERYGMWMTISSVTALLAFADLGIGNGLLNAISHAHGHDDEQAAREAVSSATALLSGIALLVVAVFAVLDLFVPWEEVFNVHTPLAVEEAGPAVIVCVVVFAANMPLGVVQRVQLGYQEGYLTYLWQILGSLFALVFVVVAIELEAGLAWLVLALSGGPLLAVVGNWMAVFRRSRRWLRPRFRYVRRVVARAILGVGLLFFVLQLAMAVGYASDNLVIAQVLGSTSVPDYAVPAKLFALVGVVVAIAFGPLWPAYGEAASRHDYPWVTRTLRRSLFWTLVACAIPSCLLVLFGQQLVHAWVGDSIDASFALLAGLAVWTVLGGLGTTLAMFLNGVGLIKVQAVLAVLMAAVSIVLKVVFADRFGVEGVAWALVVAYTTCIAVPLAFYVPSRLQAMRGEPRVAGASCDDESVEIPATPPEWLP